MKKLKRLSASLMLAAALTAGSATPGVASGVGDTKGPACVDINDTSLYYDTFNSKVTLQVILVEDACSQATYEATLTNSDGTLSPTSSSTSGNIINFEWAMTSVHSEKMCSQATTAIGGRVFDSSPDSGSQQCVDIVDPDGSGGVRYG